MLLEPLRKISGMAKLEATTSCTDKKNNLAYMFHVDSNFNQFGLFCLLLHVSFALKITLSMAEDGESEKSENQNLSS